MSSEHVSTFELDVFQASTPAEREGEANRPIAEHVAACDRCRAYLASLDATPSLAEVVGETGGADVLSFGALRALAPAAAFVAIAAAILLWVRARGEEEAAYVGEKGAPALQALIRRDGHVRVWDGAAAVRPGDAIALTVACERYRWVTVAAQGEGLTRAWEGECPSGPPVTLPFTLVVDGQPGRERFVVVLSPARLADDSLGAALRAGSRDDGAWTIDFDFAKEER